MDYQYSKDWFSDKNAPTIWPQLIPLLPARKNILEVGAFEGRATMWILDNMVEDGGEVDCIDTWAPVMKSHREWCNVHDIDLHDVEMRFDHNVKLAIDKYTKDTGKPQRGVNKYKGLSHERLAQLMVAKKQYDFIYIDAAHEAPPVMTDACMAWPLLKPNGVLVFDDYMLGNPRDILHRPKAAIDSFTNLFAEEVQVIHIGTQAAIRRQPNADRMA